MRATGQRLDGHDLCLGLVSIRDLIKNGAGPRPLTWNQQPRAPTMIRGFQIGGFSLFCAHSTDTDRTKGTQGRACLPSVPCRLPGVLRCSSQMSSWLKTSKAVGGRGAGRHAKSDGLPFPLSRVVAGPQLSAAPRSSHSTWSRGSLYGPLYGCIVILQPTLR